MIVSIAGALCRCRGKIQFRYLSPSLLLLFLTTKLSV